MVENRRDDKILIPYEDTTFPPWHLDSVQTLFSQTGWGWGRRPGSALAARLAHCQAGDFARLIHLLGQDEMGGNNEQFAHHRYDSHPFFHSAMN